MFSSFQQWIFIYYSERQGLLRHFKDLAWVRKKKENKYDKYAQIILAIIQAMHIIWVEIY